MRNSPEQDSNTKDYSKTEMVNIEAVLYHYLNYIGNNLVAYYGSRQIPMPTIWHTEYELLALKSLSVVDAALNTSK